MDPAIPKSQRLLGTSALGWKAAMKFALLAMLAISAMGALHVKNAGGEEACTSEDLRRRAQLQNKLASVCEDMCKEVGAYPKCSGCPDFVPPDATPGVMTWDELLEHMDNLSDWGHEQLKAWAKQASALQKAVVSHAKDLKIAQDSKACTAQDLQHRAQVQNKLAGVCEDMCK